MIHSFEKKKQYLAEHGEIDVFSPIPKELSLITTSSNSASLIKSFLMKIQKLFRLNSSTPQAKDL